MNRLPFEIARRLRSMFLSKHRPLCLVMDEEMHLQGWWGDPAEYGLVGLRKGLDCTHSIDFLVGYDGLSTLEIPFLQTVSGRVVHVTVVPGPGSISVIVLDAKDEHARQRDVQQKANQVRILSYQQEKLAGKLREVGDELEQRRREAEAASRTKSRFIAGMSHEFRTPLTSILGYAEVMRQQATVAPQHLDLLDAIERGAKHLLFLVENLLDQARIESGGIQLSIDTVNVPKLFEDLQGLFEPIADKAGLDLSVQGVEQVPEFIECDELRLKQILINLIGNACKYTREGSVTVTGLWQPVNGTRDGKLEVQVCDTGPGIPEQHQQRIFKGFQRVGHSDQPGAGLGLAIARYLVGLMKGSLSLKSSPGVGSTFTVAVPVRAVDPKVIEQTQTTISTAHPGKGKKVLIAEDNEDIVELIRIFLNDAGYQVLCAEDGQEAVDLAMEHQPDLVLMDMNMPVLDGNSATRSLRQADYQLPILALTASNSQKDRQSAWDAGCNDYVLKPIDMPNLLRIVSRYTENSDAV